MNEVVEFQAWKRWVAQCGRCQAITKAGTQCKNDCVGMGSEICGYEDFALVEFLVGSTDRCRVHQPELRVLGKASSGLT